MSASAKPHDVGNADEDEDDDLALTPTAQSRTTEHTPRTNDKKRSRAQQSAGSSKLRAKLEGDEDDDSSWLNNGGTPGSKSADNPARAAARERQRAQLAAAASAYAYQVTKMKHLKKEDGVPLWRKDIQYDFLHYVLHDQTRCFTKFSEGTKDHTFAEVYVDAMAKSSKCSKVLRDKLLQDQPSAITMAMVCLLVNIGRMNTTLNFFPEMRAQLRTYHPIPALQAHQDQNAYKQLQDAPRLKSILKGATEDTPQPSTVEDIRAAAKPRTNAVNLIFIMNQYCPKITELHFPGEQDFFDLIMKTDTSSKSRAHAFLWLMWWYLESDFTYEDSQRCPFGPGEFGEGDRETDPLQVKVPALVSLTPEEEAAENVDPEEELKFGEDKQRERAAILAHEPSPAVAALKRVRKDKHGGSVYDDEGSEAGWGDYSTSRNHGRSSALLHETGSEMTRSPSPGGGRALHSNTKHSSEMRINNLLSDDINPDQSPPRVSTPIPRSLKKGPGRGNWRRKHRGDLRRDSDIKTLLPNPLDNPYDLNDTTTPRSFKDPNTPFSLSIQKSSFLPTPSYQSTKRSRGMTQHQSAVVNHRKQQIDYSLDKRIRRAHARAREKRENESSLIRAWKRIRYMPSDYDSEEEIIRTRRARERSDNQQGDEWRAGRGNGKDYDEFLDNADLWRRPRMLYAGYVRIPNEPTDVGEESKSLAQSIRRVSRRLERWQENALPGQVIMRRVELERGGGLVIPQPRKTVTAFDIVIEPEEERDSALGAGTAAGGGGPPGGRRGGGNVRGKMRTGGRGEEKEEMDVDGDEDDGEGEGEGDGAAELDEEDREILGEVDADESEDEDEEMED